MGDEVEVGGEDGQLVAAAVVGVVVQTAIVVSWEHKPTLGPRQLASSSQNPPCSSSAARPPPPPRSSRAGVVVVAHVAHQGRRGGCWAWGRPGAGPPRTEAAAAAIAQATAAPWTFLCHLHRTGAPRDEIELTAVPRIAESDRRGSQNQQTLDDDKPLLQRGDAVEGEALGHHRRLPQPTRHRAPRPSRPRVFFPRRGRARLVPAGQPALLQLGQRAPLPCRRVVGSRKQPRPPLPDLPGAVEVLCRRERGVDTAEPATAAAEARRFWPVAEPGSPAQLDAAALRRPAAQGQALQQVVRVRAALRRSKARRSEAKAQSGRIHKVGCIRCGKRTCRSSSATPPPGSPQPAPCRTSR